MANYDSLKNSAIEIRDEKRAGYNTAERVGRVMYNLAGAIESVDKSKQNTLSEGNGISLSGNVLRVKYGTGLEIKDGALCAKPQESAGGNVDVATIAKQMTASSATIEATTNGTLVLKDVYRTTILSNTDRITALENSGGGSGGGTAYTFGQEFINSNNHISLRLGGGLKINENNEIVISIGTGIAYDSYNRTVHVNYGGGLYVNEQTKKLEISIGSGLHEDSGKKLGLKLSTALVFDDKTGAVGVDIEKLRTLLAGTPGVSAE